MVLKAELKDKKVYDKAKGEGFGHVTTDVTTDVRGYYPPKFVKKYPLTCREKYHGRTHQNTWDILSPR